MSYLGIDLLKKTSGLEKSSKAGSATGANSEALKTSASKVDKELLSEYEDKLVELQFEEDGATAKDISAQNLSSKELDGKIKEKEASLKKLEEDTEKYIQECQEKIEQIFAKGTDYIPKEVQNKYKSESNSIAEDINANSKDIKEQGAIISSNKLSIEEANKEIEEAQKEIEKKQEEINELLSSDDPDAESKISNLQGEIGKLNGRITDLKLNIENSNSIIKKAQNACESLVEKNEDLAKDSSGLLDKLMKNYYASHDEKDRVKEDSGLAQTIKGLENKISSAQSNLTNKKLSGMSELESLRNAKALKQQQEAAASSSSGTTNYPIGNTTYNGDLPSDERFAQIAKNMATSMGSTGLCLRGVNRSVQQAYGFALNQNSAYQAIPVMQGKSDFEEVTSQYKSDNDLKNLPAGAIVIWENSSAHPHGHISVALGNGQEASDHVQNQITNYGTQYHVFVKKKS